MYSSSLQWTTDTPVLSCFMYRMLVRQEPSQRSAAAASFTQGLSSWLAAIHPIGPLALGEQLSLVDCAAAPFLLRLPILEHYRHYKAPEQLGSTLAERLQVGCEPCVVIDLVVM